MPIRAVLDTSALVPAQQRHQLQQLAMSEVGLYTGIWSPWIIAELNRVLTWRWIKDPPPGRVRNDLSDANERRCAQAAKTMMEVLLATFELVNPRPPYPPPWEQLDDAWDVPVWAAAVESHAQYVVSENTEDFPPPDADGRHACQGITYMTGQDFLTMLLGA
jgi:PIN domain